MEYSYEFQKASGELPIFFIPWFSNWMRGIYLNFAWPVLLVPLLCAARCVSFSSNF